MTEEAKKIIGYLSSVVECRDMSAEFHCHHVRRIVELILEKMKIYCPQYHLTDDICEQISCAAALHDIGKITVSDRILCKPGRLTEDEFMVMKNHTRKGEKIFRHIYEQLDETSPDRLFFQTGMEVCKSHHERYDGEGYPMGLCGDEIPISAQVVGLADSYDVLVSERIYKQAYSKEEAFEMIMDGECGTFSPTLLNIFQMLRMEIEEAWDSKENKRF